MSVTIVIVPSFSAVGRHTSGNAINLTSVSEKAHLETLPCTRLRTDLPFGQGALGLFSRVSGVSIVRGLTAEEIKSALTRLESGLTSYLWLQERVRRRDVTTDAEFQKRFSAFYRVRRNHDWRNFYFCLFESAKASGMDFPTALRKIKESTQRIEASFSSKLVATLDPTKPVIDRFVLQYFGLRLPAFGSVDREAKTIAVYKQLCAKYEEFMRGPTAAMILELFEARYAGFKHHSVEEG